MTLYTMHFSFVVDTTGSFFPLPWFITGCYLYLFPYSGVQHHFHIRCSCLLTVMVRVTVVEQERISLPVHLCSRRDFFREVYFRSIFLNFLCSELSTIVYVFCHYSFPHCIVCSSI